MVNAHSFVQLHVESAGCMRLVLHYIMRAGRLHTAWHHLHFCYSHSFHAKELFSQNRRGHTASLPCCHCVIGCAHPRNLQASKPVQLADAVVCMHLCVTSGPLAVFKCGKEYAW
jgi:hypothetical protein